MRNMALVVLFTLCACVSETPTDVLPSLVGMPVQAAFDQFGQPIIDRQYTATNKCENPKKIGEIPVIRPTFGLSSEDRKKAEGCGVNSWPYFYEGKYANIPRDKDIRELQFKVGNLRTMSFPTTATTKIVGNTAYTTVQEGGSSTFDTRCRIKVFVAGGIIHSYFFDGEGC